MWKFSALAIVTTVLATPAVAIDCTDLKPTPPQNQNTEFTGKVDGAVDGLFAKLVNAKADVAGTYKSVATSVLQTFPNASSVYMWERVLFLQCQLIANAPDISSREKLAIVGDLYVKFKAPPPDAAPSGNSITNTGNNNVNINGNDNTTNK
jgi:hypothetical protein